MIKLKIQYSDCNTKIVSIKYDTIKTNKEKSRNNSGHKIVKVSDSPKPNKDSNTDEQRYN